MDTPASTSPDTPAASALRFATELAAWIAAPWALAPHSVPLAVASVMLLVGLPTVFATPGDKKHVMVAVPGPVTIFLVLLQLAAAVAASWSAWPAPAAVAVTVLAAACLVLEQPRRRWLAAARRPPAGRALKGPARAFHGVRVTRGTGSSRPRGRR